MFFYILVRSLHNYPSHNYHAPETHNRYTHQLGQQIIKHLYFVLNLPQIFRPHKIADPYNQPGGAGYQYGNAGGHPQPPPSMQQPPHVGFVPLVQPQPGQQLPYSQMPHAYPGGFVDPENPLGPEVKGFDFTEQSVRKGFIRKVYSILSVSFVQRAVCVR